MKDKIHLLTYFPFIGWYISLWAEKEDELILFHIKQSFFMAAFSAGISIFFILSTIFVPESMKELRFGIVILIYIIYLAYFIFSVLGTLKIEKEEKDYLPLIGKFIEKYAEKIIL